MELISREEVLKCIDETIITKGGEENSKDILARVFQGIKSGLIKKIESIPTIESRPKGEWLGISYDGYADGNPVYTEWKCSNCGLEINDDNGEILWNYCPDCGAEMRGEE